MMRRWDALVADTPPNDGIWKLQAVLNPSNFYINATFMVSMKETYDLCSDDTVFNGWYLMCFFTC